MNSHSPGMTSLQPMLFSFFLLTTITAQSQTTRINYPLQTATLSHVFKAICYQTDYCPSSVEDVKNIMDSLVTLELKNVLLDDFLSTFMPKCGIAYNIQNKTIFLKKIKDGPLLPLDKTVQKNLPKVEGFVLNQHEKLLAGIEVRIKGGSGYTMTNEQGHFILKNVEANAVLSLSGKDIGIVEIKINGSNQLIIHLKTYVQYLDDFNVTLMINNGYQRIHKDHITGSIDFINHPLIDRGVSTNILDRLENLSPGVLTNRGAQTSDASSLAAISILIRGRSTLSANANPLIVLDNFPYDGDPNNINPNDIENASILKDAAATSIWGARAGNGVIVLTSKKGITPYPQITVNSSLSFQSRPSLFNIHTISSNDYIDLEKDLYKQKLYDPDFNNTLNYIPVTPVVMLLHAAEQGSISPTEASSRIEAMKKYDVRNDIQKYLYQNSINQQHSIQLSGRLSRSDYYFSAGWDHNLSNLSGTQYDRITLRTQNNYTVSNRLKLSAGLTYTEGINQNGNNPGYNYQSIRANKKVYPYARLADAQGNALPFYADYNPDYLQKTASLGFLDWTYSPLRDIYEEKNKVRRQDYLLNLGAQYKILPSLDIDLKYQFERQNTFGNDLHTDSSYYTRDLINSLTQVDPVNNSLSYPVPLGGIEDLNHQAIISHQGRALLNYHNYWDSTHDLSLMGGYEIRSLDTIGNSSRLYGLGNPSAISPVNDNSLYPAYITGNFNYIPFPSLPVNKKDHFMSYFASGSYTYRNSYTLSASAREDEANIFGVKANQKGVPLWSVGGTWQLSNENFFHSAGLPFFAVRASYGSSGNISRLATAYTTAVYTPGQVTGTPYSSASIQNPPNDRLSWEVVKIVNIGLDLATKNKVLTGTIEYYRKNATGLVAKTAADPTLGFIQDPGSHSFFYGNTASMKGKGLDIELATRNLTGKFAWTTNYIFSYSSSRVTRFALPVGAGNAYLDQNTINPVLGKPLYAVYSYKWLGLDPQTGDPRGSYNGKSSTDWNSIYNNTALDSMVYNGPAQPVIFGALRNSFTWNHFSLSFNISYKFGYYFRKPSLRYGDLFNNWNGSSTYAQRWQKSGDEKRTNVPSIRYATNSARDDFYTYSSVQVDRADNIRLEDMRIAYETNKFHWGKFHCPRLCLYSYLSNLGLLWKANKDGIDPYYINVPKDGKRISLGMNVTF